MFRVCGNFNSRLVTNFVPIKMLEKIENRPIFDKIMTLDKRVSNSLGHDLFAINSCNKATKL